jgi:hypothetical protein
LIASIIGDPNLSRSEIEALSDEELTTMVHSYQDDPSRRRPAQMVLDALEASAEGLPFRPYGLRVKPILDDDRHQ